MILLLKIIGYILLILFASLALAQIALDTNDNGNE